MKIIGIHDHAVPITKWMEEPTSYTWIKALKGLPGIKQYYLATNEAERQISITDRDEFHFLNKNFQNWIEKIKSESPSVVLFNVCYYSKWADKVSALRKKIPQVTFICRVHHDVRYLWQQPGFCKFLQAMDVIIAPSEIQANILEQTFPQKKIYNQIFTADVDWVEGVRTKEYKLVTTANKHPARNFALIKQLVKRIDEKIGKTRNLNGLKRSEFLKLLKTSEYFLLPSLTEASGSRVMIEAIKSGCIPIVFSECESAVELLRQYGVKHYKIESGLRYLKRWKIVLPSPFALGHIEREISKIIEMESNNSEHCIVEDFNEANEVAHLQEIILNV